MRVLECCRFLLQQLVQAVAPLQKTSGFDVFVWMLMRDLQKNRAAIALAAKLPEHSEYVTGIVFQIEVQRASRLSWNLWPNSSQSFSTSARRPGKIKHDDHDKKKKEEEEEEEEVVVVVEDNDDADDDNGWVVDTPAIVR
jgi:hypothetical protein